MSMSMGGGKSEQQSGVPGFIKNIVKEQWSSAAPVMKEWGSQLMEALTTGGVNAKIPIIQRAVENARMSSARALNQTQEQNARAGIGGTFARGIEAKQQQQGEFDVSQVLTAIVNEFLKNAQNFGFMTGSPAATGAAGTAKMRGRESQFKVSGGLMDFGD